MAILLDSVVFGIDGAANSPLAPLSLTRGEDPRATAQWVRGESNNPEDFPFVIIRGLLPLDDIFVTPTFRKDGDEEAFRWSVSCTGMERVRPTGFGVENRSTRFDQPVSDPSIGHIDPVRASFPAGSTVRTAGRTGFKFRKDDLAWVACRDITLTWSMTETRTQQVSREETRHRMYVILAPPSLPWSAAFEDRERWLWPEVLDFACNWAEGARTVDEAARMITAALFDLGQADERRGGLRYHGSARYAKSWFLCNEFLDHLTGKAPSSSVNCSDLATILSTFANALGCRLYQAQCGRSIVASPVRVIGSPADPPTRFGYHEIAWDGSSSENDRVWDACLAFSDDPPAGVPFPEYGAAAFTSCPEATGPVFTANRPVKPHRPQPLTARVEVRALELHPELRQIPELQKTEPERSPEAVTGLLSGAARGLALLNMLGGNPVLTLQTISGRQWTGEVLRFVQGERAWQARYTFGKEGAAEIRVSVFESAEEAKRYLLAETHHVAEPLISWKHIAEHSDFVIGAADGRTLFMKLGRIAITGRVSFGQSDIAAVIRELSSRGPLTKAAGGVSSMIGDLLPRKR